MSVVYRLYLNSHRYCEPRMQHHQQRENYYDKNYTLRSKKDSYFKATALDVLGMTLNCSCVLVYDSTTERFFVQ